MNKQTLSRIAVYGLMLIALILGAGLQYQKTALAESVENETAPEVLLPNDPRLVLPGSVSESEALTEASGGLDANLLLPNDPRLVLPNAVAVAPEGRISAEAARLTALAEFFAAEAEAERVEAIQAEIAAWNSATEFYGFDISESPSAMGIEADRWQALAKFYAAESAARMRAIQTEAARWQALAEFYAPSVGAQMDTIHAADARFFSQVFLEGVTTEAIVASASDLHPADRKFRTPGYLEIIRATGESMVRQPIDPADEKLFDNLWILVATVDGGEGQLDALSVEPKVLEPVYAEHVMSDAEALKQVDIDPVDRKLFDPSYLAHISKSS